MEKYKELLHAELNEDGITRYEQLINVSGMLDDLVTQGSFFESLKEEHKTDTKAYKEGITVLAEELDRLYKELK